MMINKYAHIYILLFIFRILSNLHNVIKKNKIQHTKNMLGYVLSLCVFYEVNLLF